MMTHEMLPITGDIFRKIENYDEFGQFVSDEFCRHAEKAFFIPQLCGNLLEEAHHCYMKDIDRMEAPDYFELCGCLAYWLRRNNPVIEWDETKTKFQLNKEEKTYRNFLFDCGRQYHAFYLGYTMCLALEHQRNPSSAKPLPQIDENYIRAACHLMKYKNISPHAMGFIYRSLFFV